MMKDIIVKSYDYIMNCDFNRIKLGKRINLNNKHYTIEYYDKLIEYFNKKEEYEKSSIILIEKNKRLNFKSNLENILKNQKY